MDAGLDAGVRELGAEIVSPPAAHDVEVMDAVRARPSQLFVVGRSDLGAAAVVVLQPPKPDPEERRLKLVQSGVCPRPAGEVARLLPVRAKLANRLGKPRVRGDNRTAVAERPEVLRRVEGEAAGDADRSRRTSVDHEPVRLRGVLDERHSERKQLVDRRRAAVEVDGNHGRCLVRHCVGSPRRIDRERLGVDVHEDGPEAGPNDRRRRRGRGEVRTEHLGSGRQLQRPQRELECVGAGGHANRRLRLGQFRELPLERLDLRAEHDPVGAHHPAERLVQVVPLRLVRPPRVEEPDVHQYCPRCSR